MGAAAGSGENDFLKICCCCSQRNTSSVGDNSISASMNMKYPFQKKIESCSLVSYIFLWSTLDNEKECSIVSSLLTKKAKNKKKKKSIFVFKKKKKKKKKKK